MDSRRKYTNRRWLSAMHMVERFRRAGNYADAHEWLCVARGWRNILEGAQ